MRSWIKYLFEDYSKLYKAKGILKQRYIESSYQKKKSSLKLKIQNLKESGMHYNSILI